MPDQEKEPTMIAVRRARVRTACLILVLSLCVACSGDMSARSLAEMGKLWVAAWNQPDPGMLLSLLDDDVILWLPGTKEQVRGKSEAAKQLSSLWSVRAEMRWHDNAIFVDAATGKVAIDWSLEYKSFGGKLVQLFGVEILHARKGLITVDRSVYNACDILAQVNAPAPAGSH